MLASFRVESNGFHLLDCDSGTGMYFPTRERIHEWLALDDGNQYERALREVMRATVAHYPALTPDAPANFAGIGYDRQQFTVISAEAISEWPS